MAHILIAGVDRRLIARLRDRLQHLPTRSTTWDYSFVPAGRLNGLSVNEVDSVLRQAAELGGAHILAVQVPGPAGRGAEQVSRLIRSAFRFRWLPAGLNAVMNDQHDFDNLLDQILNEEEWWRANVLPTSCHDPQVLPGTFSAHNDLVSFWRVVEAYNDLPTMQTVSGLLKLFPQLHRMPKGASKAWRDKRDLVWDDYGAHHGAPPFPQDWKYSYKTPQNFHFDVTHAHDKAFTYACAAGGSHTRKRTEHVNVNSHGYVLGASV